MKGLIEEDNKSNGNNSNTTNSDTPNENGWSDSSQQSCSARKREKRTRNRPSKAERYTEEREELIKDLNNLTGINEKNHMILYELNNNEKLKEKIRELVP